MRPQPQALMEDNIIKIVTIGRGTKRKGDELAQEKNKRQKITDLSRNNDFYFLELPNDLIRQIASWSESLAALLLSITCTRIYNLFRNDNRLWHSIYLREGGINGISIENTIAHDVLGFDRGSVAWERESLAWATYEHSLTSDSIDFANEIIAEEDSYAKYFPLGFHNDYNPIEYPRKYVSFTEYSPSVNYKKLALKAWYNFNQYDYWSVQRHCARLWKYKHCTCFGLPDLEMSNELGEKIAIVETNEKNEKDEFDSNYSSQSESDDETSSLDGGSTSENSLSTQETYDSLLDDISGSDNFKYFAQVLSGLLVGHCASPGCKHSYQIRMAKMLNTTVVLKDVTEVTLDQIRTAIDNDDSFECMSSIVCALQKFSLDDLLTLHECVKQRFPYLATVSSVLDIEENSPYVWPFFASHHEMPWSYHFQADIATKEDHETIPDWLSIRHSMLKLFRRAGIFCATPNSTEYGISALGAYIKSVLGSVVRSKPADTEQLEISEGMILHAIKSPLANNKNGTTLYSPSLELMQDDSIIMYSDSELSTNEESSFADASEEDDLAEFLQEANNKDDSNDEEDDEDISDDFKSLNDVIKNSVPGLNEDNSPLLMKSAVVYAQADVPYGEISEVVGTEEDDEKEDQEFAMQNQMYSDEDDEFSAFPEEANDLEEALEYHNKAYEKCLKFEASYYGVVNKNDREFELDLPLKDMSDEQRAKTLALRRETNRIMKEEADKEFQFDCQRATKRLEENVEHYNPMTCKSMVIVMNCHGPKLRSIVEQAVDIISNSKVLKSVKLKWVWLEKEVTLDDDNSYSMLIDELAKCSTLKKLILEDCELSADGIQKQLPNVEVIVKHYKPDNPNINLRPYRPSFLNKFRYY